MKVRDNWGISNSRYLVRQTKGHRSAARHMYDIVNGNTIGDSRCQVIISGIQTTSGDEAQSENNENWDGASIGSEDDAIEDSPLPPVNIGSIAIEDLLHLPLRRRIAIFDEWVELVVEMIHDKLRTISTQFQRNEEHIQAIQAEANGELVKRMKIVGFTTSGAAKYHHLLSAVGTGSGWPMTRIGHTHAFVQIDPDVLIVEEAAEVLEGHVLAALTPGLRHLVMIG
jgi:hypothetical protein